jgi:hypothetical protein
MELYEQFFKISLDAIAQEDLALRALFELNEEKYEDQHHGIGFLFETTYVYLIYKRLLADKFPAKVIWECSYPSQPRKLADLGLMADGHITSLIEFKLWKKENDKQLVADIAKLNLEQKGINKWLLVLSFGGNRNQNRKYLTDRNPLLKLERAE